VPRFDALGGLLSQWSNLVDEPLIVGKQDWGPGFDYDPRQEAIAQYMKEQGDLARMPEFGPYKPPIEGDPRTRVFSSELPDRGRQELPLIMDEETRERWKQRIIDQYMRFARPPGEE
jgi:hypothetical protein